jgi:hypothetical protein
MSYILVIGMFDDLAALEETQREVVQANLASAGAMRVEPDALRVLNRIERLKDLLPLETEESHRHYAEGMQRGSQLLIVTVPQEEAELVRHLMSRNGAAETGRPVQPRSSSPLGFEPPPPLPERLVDEPDVTPRVCIDETAPDNDAEANARNIKLFDEATGREIGRISEGELKVLQDALEEEDPDDNDYWINDDEIDDIACRPGATVHLVTLLRAAVHGNPDGIDIAFQRDGEARQSIRGNSAAASHGQS